MSKKYQLLGPSGGEEAEDLLEQCKDNHEAVQRLQALLSEWLRMENLVVLTAAGCSVGACGGKTMVDLETAVLKAVGEIPATLDDGKAGLSDEVKKLIDVRLKDGDRPDWAMTGFEQWLSYLVNAVYLATKTNSPIESLTWKGLAVDIDEVERLISYLSKAIYAECALTLPDDTASDVGRTIAPHLALLSKLVARDSNLGRTHLFTLNYDTLFEQALELLGIQYFDGFTGRANARFDPSVYGLDVYYPGELAEGRVRRFDKFMHYYKLHGSIHWRLNSGELRAQHSDVSAYEAYRKKEPADKAKDLTTEKFAPNYQEFGILPTSNKFIQTLDMPYSHLFRALQARLSAPQTFLLVLGYGFGDDHITRIIETALMNPALVMLVVEPNPDSEIIKKIARYKELGKRAFILTPTEATHANNPYKYSTFDDFAKSVLPDVQWLDDFLRLRRFEVQLQKNTSQNPAQSVSDDNGSEGVS